ncbi:hypothetical protein SV7mr_24650 [Stieleria bergensis]|uniref:DUF1963 domain-containing protein n=1 Tax=Stieleria bergensis TaxID=2528025 RepID=A0A517SUZ8_9BACT|nr:hypothetical protein SV7mr_24650 [Planctomycetes bacterium SV_7m_r]
MPDCFDELVNAVVPFVGAETQRCEEESIPIGDSKFCGEPDLPPNFQWPQSSDGPCHFVCQLNLAQLSSFESIHPLPPLGLLSFFYHDAEGHPEGADSVVHYFSDTQLLVRTPVVPDIRFGMQFHRDHQYARNLSFGQRYVIEEDEFSNDDRLADFVDRFNNRFARATHRLFGLPRYWTKPDCEHITLGSFGEWADRINFSVPLSGLNELNFSALEVDYYCT